MDELVKRIDPHFAYEWHETEDGILRVYVRSTRKDAQCPYCGSISKQVHSVYPRKFRDLPIQGKKVEVVIRNRKFYCQNVECGHKTFAESYECLPGMGYCGSDSTIRMYASRKRRHDQAAAAQCQQNADVVERKYLLKLLYKPMDKIKGFTSQQLYKALALLYESAEKIV